MIFNMFNNVSKSIENMFDVINDIVDGRDIDKKKLAKLIADGIEISTIAGIMGISEDIIREIVDKIEK